MRGFAIWLFGLAAEQPREILVSALAALFDEVEATNAAALAHVASLRAGSLGLAS